MKKLISVFCFMLLLCTVPAIAACAEGENADTLTGGMSDKVSANSEILTGADAEQGAGLAEGYLYSLTNGMPKYWLDLSGAVDDNLVLHCYFRSSDPTFYESCYMLDLSSAAVTADGLDIRRVCDQYDLDHSNWFDRLTLRFYPDCAVMSVERDERTLAGGAEDNILTGTYVMKPVGVGLDSAEKRSHLRPVEEGPYEAEELGAWAQIHYFGNTGFFPPVAEVMENQDGTFTVHLFEIVDLDGMKHTATSAWYTVDAYGEGENDITGESVSLMQ